MIGKVLNTPKVQFGEAEKYVLYTKSEGRFDYFYPRLNPVMNSGLYIYLECTLSAAMFLKS